MTSRDSADALQRYRGRSVGADCRPGGGDGLTPEPTGTSAITGDFSAQVFLPQTAALFAALWLAISGGSPRTLPRRRQV